MQVPWRRGALGLILLSCWAVGGCSALNPGADALSAYEATRRQINQDASGVQPAAYEEGSEETEAGGLTGTVRRLTGNAPNRELARQLKAEAEALYQEAAQLRQQAPDGDHPARFVAAADKFDAAAKAWADSTLEQDALFMQGECYFFADRYPQAEDAYETLLKKYPHSRHLDRVQPRRFAVAQYWLTLHDDTPQNFLSYNVTDRTRPGRDTFGEAIRIFDRIRLDDPTGKLADDATLAMGNAFFNRGNFIRADEHYEDLRKTFPSSEHQFRAHFLGLKSKLMNYLGPDYSGAALEQAGKLLDQIRKQFPVEAAQEREYLAKAAAEIRFRRAEREWHSAKHYDRRAEYGAARFHYQTLVGEYHDTPFATRAGQRLDAIGGLPDEPPQRFGFLVNLFPEGETVEPLIEEGPPIRR